MSTIKRRHFLQGAASTLTALGVSQMNVFQQAQQYDRALAQGKPGRKLALLVGINGYSVKPLFGCHTDVELQWELLVHRYGFSPKDILVIADREFSFLDYKPQAPTRKNILEAYEQHLIGKATADSTVVFHYSGHGGLIQDPSPLPKLLMVDFDGNRIEQANTEKAAGTILPIDHATSNTDEVNDIMGKSLFLLTYALAKKTQNITTVLDSCHSGGSFRGNLNVRTIRDNAIPKGKPSAQELEYQQRWLKDLGLSEAEFQKLRMNGIAAGVAIGSVQYDQLAADAAFDGFRAGALTYTLTRYLWQQPVNESIDAVFANIASRTQEIGKSNASDQKPLFDVSQDGLRQQPIYLSQPELPFADAIVRQVTSKDQIVYWLGGVSTQSLIANKAGTLFSVINAKGEEIGQVEHTKRDGLKGEGRLVKGNLGDLQLGTLMREKVRGLPTNLKLRIGLDPSLGADMESARAALSSIPRIEVVASDQAMDYRFGRITPAYKQQFAQYGVSEGAIGLFSPALTPMTATFGLSGESVAERVDKLRSQIQSLLATMVLKAMGGIDTGSNGRTRSLTVAVAPTGKAGRQVGPSQYAPQTQIQVKVKNTGAEPVYVGVVSIGGAGNLRVLYPYSDDFDSAEEKARLLPGKELTLPEPEVIFPLSKTPGAIEIMVFSSRQPIRDALRGLKEISRSGRGGITGRGGFSRDAMEGTDAVDTLGALLGDIDRNTRNDIEVQPSVRGVGVNQFTLVSTVIQVVK
jgi:Caspase domain/Domain of unknown function (DUF4384)